MISIHAPRTGSDRCDHNASNAGKYFNPRSPHGERRLRRTKRLKPTYFNPRSPHGERPPSAAGFSGWGYFNPRSPHGERRGAFQVSDALSMISIHAPRTGSDISFSTSSIVSRHFNPRSPHGERLDSMSSNSMKSSFQSTLPARGATIRPRFSATKSRHFNPRSPHGERRAALRVLRVIRRISIHAPRTGSDGHSFLFARLKYLFQSTLPARGATSSCSGRVPVLIYFNPRSPHGERLDGVHRVLILLTISIHAPRTGSDSPTWA